MTPVTTTPTRLSAAGPRTEPVMLRDRNLSGALLVIASVALLTLVVIDGADLRRFSTALGVAVFALLVWRTVGSWHRLTDMERVLALLLAFSPLVAALASLSLTARAGGTLPPNPWLWGILAHRAACLVVVAFWDKIMGRRTDRSSLR